MSLFHLIYASRPFGFDQGALNGILVNARASNARDQITGALICRADLYLQLLEGPERAVMACFGRIRRDDRHLEVRILSSGPIPERRFGAWAMLDDPARSWLWDREAVAAGALDAAPPKAVEAVFDLLKAEMDVRGGAG